jgi:hypothetical protein
MQNVTQIRYAHHPIMMAILLAILNFVILAPTHAAESKSLNIKTLCLQSLQVTPELSISDRAIADRLRAEFETFYYSPAIDPIRCAQNVQLFADHLRSKGLLPYEFTTLDIRNHDGFWGFGQLIALNARWGTPLAQGLRLQKWSFHAVGLHNGLVYDFSYGVTPTVMPLDQYIESMFQVPEHHTDIMPYGPSFRIRGEGPAYLRKHSIEEMKSAVFKFYVPSF